MMVPGTHADEMVMIVQASDGDIQEIRILFEEYAKSLGVGLGFQDFESELAGLPGAYGSPGGCLLLATDGARSVGCVGVRPLADGVCEMKRLYVRPEARGQAVGRRLVEGAIAFARRTGYRTMRLDTCRDDRRTGAYRQMGFRESRLTATIRFRAQRSWS